VTGARELLQVKDQGLRSDSLDSQVSSNPEPRGEQYSVVLFLFFGCSYHFYIKHRSRVTIKNDSKDCGFL